ncbi:MAG: response regulator [Hyphomicrobiales bacterium]|nr:response regulator [Hyphomicrobiales bacterium]
MKQVLIVDDSPVIRKVARRLLEAEGVQVSEAEDGKQGLAACAFLMPDAILVDWMMPEVDGFKFVKELRAMPGGAAPKVVFLASDNDVASMARAMHAGADEYMLKPFDGPILKDSFRRAGAL